MLGILSPCILSRWIWHKSHLHWLPSNAGMQARRVYLRPLFLSSASVEISIATVDINRRRVEEIYSLLLFCPAPGTFPFKDDS